MGPAKSQEIVMTRARKGKLAVGSREEAEGWLI